MVKKIHVENEYPVSVRRFQALLYGDEEFKIAFHRARGDQKVDVCEWIDRQRVCFYSMVDASGGGEVTRVLERERYEWEGDEESGEGALLVFASITPENPLGNVFKIEVEWKIESVGESKCLAKANGTVECTARAWGLQKVAEGVLQSQSEQSLKQWLEAASKRIEVYLQNQAQEPERDSGDGECSDDHKQRIGVREESGGIRMRGGPGDTEGDKCLASGAGGGGGGEDRSHKLTSNGEEGGELDSFSVHIESNEELLRGLSSPCVRIGERREEPDFPWIMLGWLLLVAAVGVIFWCLNYRSMM